MNRIAIVLGIVFSLAPLLVVAEEFTAGDYIEFWKPVVGKWKATIEPPDGKVHKGAFDLDIAPNNKCILLYHGAEGRPFTQQLQGYDPVAQKQVAFGFRDDDSFQIQTITIDGMKQGKKAAEGDCGSWELKVFGADGKTTTTSSKWSFTHLTEKKVVMVWSEIQEEGKPTPGIHKLTLEQE